MKSRFENPFYWVRFGAAIVYFIVMCFVNLLVFLASLFNHRAVCNCMRWEAVGLLALLGIRVRIMENMFPGTPGKKTNFLFISNHQSMLDILVILSLVPVPLSFIAKKELFWAPFLNVHLWLAGCLSIDRNSLKRSYRDIKRAVDVLKRKRSLIMFPEGTRQTEDRIGPFKAGFLKLAQEAGVSVVPIVMRGTGKVMKKKSMKMDTRAAIEVSIAAPIPSSSLKGAQSAEEIRKLFIRTYEKMRVQSPR